MRTKDTGRARAMLESVGMATTLLLALATAAMAGPPVTETLGIAGEGAIHPLPQAAYQPQGDATYKVVFALTKAGDVPQDVSPSLIRIARTVNLYGAATRTLLDDEHYKEKFGVANRNLILIHKLQVAGVDAAVCGQAVLESKFDYAWMSRDVTVALSALTTITVLQQQGYGLMPL